MKTLCSMDELHETNHSIKHCTKNKVCHEGFFFFFLPNQQKITDWVTFTVVILNGKLRIFLSVFFVFWSLFI